MADLRATTMWSPSPPMGSDALLDAMHSEICDEFDDVGDDIAEEMFAKGKAKADRLDELIAAAWATFVAEAGMTREIYQSEDENE